MRPYVMAARAYAEQFDFERMEQTLDKLTRRAPRHPGVHHYVGETVRLSQVARPGNCQLSKRPHDYPEPGRLRGWSSRRCLSEHIGWTRPRR